MDGVFDVCAQRFVPVRPFIVKKIALAQFFLRDTCGLELYLAAMNKQGQGLQELESELVSQAGIQVIQAIRVGSLSSLDCFSRICQDVLEPGIIRDFGGSV